MIPLPSEEVTPPVTNTYFVEFDIENKPQQRKANLVDSNHS